MASLIHIVMCLGRSLEGKTSKNSLLLKREETKGGKNEMMSLQRENEEDVDNKNIFLFFRFPLFIFVFPLLNVLKYFMSL